MRAGEENTVGLIGEIEQQSALLASEDNDFLIRMGVSRKLLTEVMYRQNAVEEQGSDRSTRRCLTQDEVLPLQRRQRPRPLGRGRPLSRQLDAAGRSPCWQRRAIAMTIPGASDETAGSAPGSGRRSTWIEEMATR